MKNRRITFIFANFRGYLCFHPYKMPSDIRYCNDLSPLDIQKTCIECGRQPTKKGHDACLGYIPGVQAACCGHGNRSKRYIMIKKGIINKIKFYLYRRFIKRLDGFKIY